MKKMINRFALPAFLCLSLVAFTAKADNNPSTEGTPAKAAKKVVYTTAETLPQPATKNMSAFYTYLRETAIYPQQAREQGVEGKLYVGFTVNTDGSLSDVKVLKGLGHGCDEEAVRLIESAANWIPGQQDGQNVNVQMILPVTFKLDW